MPQVPRRSKDRPDQELYVYLGVISVIVLYLVGFVAVNARSVEVDFLLFSAGVSLIWLIVLSLLLGFAAGLAFAPLRQARRRRAAAPAPAAAKQPPTDPS